MRQLQHISCKQVEQVEKIEQIKQIEHKQTMPPPQAKSSSCL